MIRWFSLPAYITYVTFFIGVALIFLSIFKRELTSREIVERCDARRPDIEHLRTNISKYMRETFKLSQRVDTVNPSTLKQLTQAGTAGNKQYIELVNSELDGLKTEIEDSISKLSDKKLRRLVHQLYRRISIGRSYQIALRGYRKRTDITTLEKNIALNSDLIMQLARQSERVYRYLAFMWEGADLE